MPVTYFVCIKNGSLQPKLLVITIPFMTDSFSDRKLCLSVTICRPPCHLSSLPMTVSEYWWPGYSSVKLCPKVIVSLDTTLLKLNCFILVLKDKSGKRYGMRYDVVVLYSNNTAKTTSRSHLLSDLSANPAHKQLVTAPCVRVYGGSCT